MDMLDNYVSIDNINLPITPQIGGVDCPVTASTATTITCTAGTLETGSFPVQVFVPQAGFSNTDVEFTYAVGSFSINPTTGNL